MKDKIIALFREGKSYKEIAEETGKTVHQIQVAISYYRKQGADGLEKRGTFGHKKVEKPAEEKAQAKIPADNIITPQPSPSPEPKHYFTIGYIHELIDMASKVPSVVRELFSLVEEIETAANYQLRLVAEIRRKLEGYSAEKQEGAA